jgi:hypothetical protein
MKTSELSGVQLDWAVAQCEKHEVKFECNLLFFSDKLQMLDYGIVYRPSKDWEYGGPIIEREWISVSVEDDTWKASNSWGHFPLEGPTPLVAAMRCYVASKLGQEVEIPKEMTNENSMVV